MSLIGIGSRLWRAMAVAEQLAGLERGAIRSDRRQTEIVRIRQLVMLFAVDHLGLGYSGTGRLMARDHTTVMHGVRCARSFVQQPHAAEFYAALVRADQSCAESEATPTVPEPMVPSLPPAPAPVAAALPQRRAALDDIWPGRDWYERNNADFVAAMRAVHPEREIALGGRP